MRVFHRVSKCEKHLKPWGCRPSGFIVFERLETWWNTKHEFLNLLLQQRKLVKLSFELVFSIQLLYLRREVCMILKKMCMMCMILSPNCCPLTIFEYSTTEVTLPSCLSVLSEHVASQSKRQSADLDLLKLVCGHCYSEVSCAFRASSYEPGNRTGSVTGTSSVVCS